MATSKWPNLSDGIASNAQAFPLYRQSRPMQPQTATADHPAPDTMYRPRHFPLSQLGGSPRQIPRTGRDCRNSLLPRRKLNVKRLAHIQEFWIMLARTLGALAEESARISNGAHIPR